MGLRISDVLKGQVRSMRNGTHLNPFTTGAQIKAAKNEREAKNAAKYPAPSRKDGYYSRARQNEKVDVFIAPNGEITSERPHVHIVHSDPEQQIFFTVTQADGTHTHREHLPSTASGNEVNEVVDRLRRKLR